MSRRDIDVSTLTDIGFMTKSPIFWGAMAVVFIEGTMFALTIASYFYARLGLDVWPPPGTQFPHLFWPTVEVILLLASVPPSYLASEASKKCEIGKIRLYLAINLALAVVAFIIRIGVWNTLNFNWKSDIHGSVVWTILGLHSFDMGADLVVTLVLIVLTLTPRFNDTHRKAVDWDGVTWYFLVGIWVCLYATIYIAPYLVKTA